MNPIVELCARKCEEMYYKSEWHSDYRHAANLCAAAIRAIPESEIAAVAGEPTDDYITRNPAPHAAQGAPSPMREFTTAPIVPEGMKLVPMDSTDCIICKKKANPWTAQIVPEKGLICVYCCDLEDAQETAPSAPAAQEGIVMVPQHPTSDQMQAGRDEWLTIKEQPDIMSIEMKCLRIYKAMLAAYGEKKT